MHSLHLTSLVLAILGAVNCFLWGVFGWDLITGLVGSQYLVVNRLVYCLSGLAGLYLAIDYFGFRPDTRSGRSRSQHLDAVRQQLLAVNEALK
jgi:uncharacterized membrane protein YuzA (DUF378 family)